MTKLLTLRPLLKADALLLFANKSRVMHAQEGGGVSKVEIGSVITASVTSHFTWMNFKMTPNG